MAHNHFPPSTPDTRPGAHSAKNARQAGAPNHQKDSEETPMVGDLNHANALLAGMPRQGKAALDWAVSAIRELETENASLRAENAVLESALAEAAWDIRDLLERGGVA